MEEVLYKNQEHLKYFQGSTPSADVVEEWYKRRTYEIEKNTGLVENALNFVILARERGVKVKRMFLLQENTYD